MPSTSRSGGTYAISEMREFASFPAQSQRYIRRSIDVALARGDAISVWSRDSAEGLSIKAQAKMYEHLGELREQIPSAFSYEMTQGFIAPLVKLSAFDLGQERLPSFGAYRFLYERLLGASVRPWLPSSFCCAAALPHIHPTKRKDLLQSISEAAATAPGWSDREPTFFPEWVEKVQ